MSSSEKSPEEAHREALAHDLREANEELLVRGLREQELAQAAQRSADELRALLENMTEGVAVFDHEGDILRLNRVGRSILGIGSDAPLEDAFWCCTFRDARGTVLDARVDLVWPMLAGERLSEQSLSVERADGTVRALAFSGSGVNQGAAPPSQAFAVFRDVTDLRELEKVRDQYFSLISHDLRGPLAIAKLSAELILETQDPLQRGSLTHHLRVSLERMDEMIRTLLDAEWLRAGKPFPLHTAPCDLREVCAEVVSELRSLHGDRFLLEGEHEVMGSWDRDQVRRAVWNLASNAVKYKAPGTVITLRCETDAQWARCSVHNEGAPIPLAEQSRLFAPFVRAPSAARPGAPQGWGLGLTMVRSCAEAHGGDVRVQSEPGKGTTFTLRLPRETPVPG